MTDRVLGALIGLARATDGSEHLINADATGLIINAFRSEGTEAELLRRIAEEKAKMVPNCLTCANPCGRTSDYDVSRLQLEPPEIRAEKERILALLHALAASFSRRHDSLFYKGLALIGIEGLSADYLAATANELEAAL